MSEALDHGFANLSFDSVARYTILEEIGRGGMGVVFLAERGCEGVTENIVLKTIKDLSPEREEELRQEANISTRLRHPNIVRTYGLESVPVSRLPRELQQALVGMGKRASPTVGSASSGVYSSRSRRARRARVRRSGASPRSRTRGSSSGQLPIIKPPSPTDDKNKLFFLLMEYVDGIDLLGLHLEHLKQATLLPTMLGAYIISRIARALEYAHNAIIHRDVSPENVMIDDQGIPLLSDFGIAVVTNTEQETRAGKLTYLAPEILGGSPADERGDIYALGLTAVLIATGITLQMTPKAESRQQKYDIIREIAERGWPALKDLLVDVPEAYSDIIARMIHPDPEQRYSRARTVANQLEQEVLYAKGLGPTSNSLKSYMDIFEGQFQDYDDAQLETLTFLRDAEGKLIMRRALTREMYTPLAHQLIEARSGSSLGRAIAHIPTKQKPPKVVATGKPMLKVRFGDNCLETIHCTGVIVIGRSEECQLTLVDNSVSRKHARIRNTPQGPVLEDLGSGNGIYVDKKKVEMAMLQEGQSFRIGTTRIYYLHEPENKPPEKVVRIQPDKLPDAAKLDRRVLPLRLQCKDRGELRPLWNELARVNGFSERATFLFTQAITELLGLLAEGDERLLLQILRDRSRLRLYIYPPPATASEPSRLGETLALFKHMAARQALNAATHAYELTEDSEVHYDIDFREIAATMVRNIFDRIDFHEQDNMVLVSKVF